MTKSNFSDRFTWLGCMKHGAPGHISLNYASSIFLRSHLCFRHLTWFLVKPCKLRATNFHLFVGILLTLPSGFFIDPSSLNYLFFTCWALTEKLTLGKLHYTLVGTIFWRNRWMQEGNPSIHFTWGELFAKEPLAPCLKSEFWKKAKFALVWRKICLPLWSNL